MIENNSVYGKCSRSETIVWQQWLELEKNLQE